MVDTMCAVKGPNSFEFLEAQWNTGLEHEGKAMDHVEHQHIKKGQWKSCFDINNLVNMLEMKN
jgi:hypothetical protein